MQDTFAHARTRPKGQARATIGYIVYKSFLIRDKRQPAISLGEYINTVVSRIVIGPLDLKVFLLTSARLIPPPPCQDFETPTPSAADVICEHSLRYQGLFRNDYG